MSTEEFSATNLLERMLSRVPDDLDKREGSIIYDALAPAAWELAATYRLLFSAYEEAFITTAEGDALDMRVEEMGLSRHEASKSLRKGIFKDTLGDVMDVEIGARFSSMDPQMSYTYVVIAKIDEGEFQLEAEEAGAGPNNYIGVLSPITHIAGLGAAEITDVLILGEDEESDDALRTRYFNFIKSEIQDGNVAQYEYWASEYSGIGRAKVLPCWNGANTVKVSILDANNRKATQTLIDEYQKYIDPSSQGLGNGVAPIGAIVTVSTADEIAVNIAISIEIKDGYVKTDVDDNIRNTLEAYFSETAYLRGSVSYMGVGAAILSAEGVNTATQLTVNDTAADIPLTSEQIGVLGTLTVMEV